MPDFKRMSALGYIKKEEESDFPVRVNHSRPTMFEKYLMDFMVGVDGIEPPTSTL